ncbi:hypothetical protein LCGC14_0220490 [marine sediment metagenome]|uniref:Uncharacterized protein n=1 Tax=marine sediment metagenome TaxID=412755 RepID=A0A0F9XGY2_9ZZZZ
MNNKKAKPGDMVILISPKGFEGQEFLVVTCPEKYKKNRFTANKVWIDMGSRVCHLGDTEWEIVKRGTGTVLEDDVDKQLKNQMNKNLNDVFG